MKTQNNDCAPFLTKVSLLLACVVDTQRLRYIVGLRSGAQSRVQNSPRLQ